MNRGCASPKVKRYDRIAESIELEQERDRISQEGSNDASIDKPDAARKNQGFKSQSPQRNDTYFKL